MEKDFDTWNDLKKTLEKRKKPVLFKEREIWWTSIGVNIANESCGKWATFRRPVLILKKLSSNSCICIPLSSQTKTGTWYSSYDIHGVVYTALLYQIRMMSTSRFQRRFAVLDDSDFQKIKKDLQQLLEISELSSTRESGIGG